ncbi:MAG TPA: 4Fe-4S dicluster domain-containing protein, partial [Pyrinomonadaceae bacterium]|nr:4Fe-4S dicluster domain-containing protein [Pyrinomonadaceae bacterium]
WNNPVERRTFLKLMGASLALAGLSGCVIQPPEKVIPYVKQPEEEVPGKGLFFATAFTLSGVATPLLVRSNEGRPTKAEGNPDHPSNPGCASTDIFSQASILTLYDPDRSQTPLYRGETRAWTSFVAEIRGAIDKESDGVKAKRGAGLRILTETITSPSLAAQIKQILTDFPEAKWHQYEPINRDNARAGAIMAFGQDVNTTYDFSKADRILSLGHDFLNAWPGNLRYARDFAQARRDYVEYVSQDAIGSLRDPGKFVRLYVVESTPTITGANADHRFPIKPEEMLPVAEGVAGASIVRASGDIGKWLPALSKDLQLHKGASIVIAGNEQPPEIHALAQAANNALGNVGKTVFYSDPLEANSVDQMQSLRELVGDIDAGKVDLLMIIGGNPAYNTPVDLRLDLNRLNKVKLRAHLSLYNNKTSEICHWHINAAHYLESWGDARAYDGTVSIVQPLIAPLYEGKTAYEVLALFSDNYDQKPYDIVRSYWSGYRTASGSERMQSATPNASTSPQNAGGTPAKRPQDAGAPDFETAWRKWLHDGFIPNTALQTKTVTAVSELGKKIQEVNELANFGPTAPAVGNYEVILRADPTIYDGRFANNGWLQELPKPLTKITWDNVALVSANTAKKLGLTPQNYEERDHGRECYVDTIKLSLRNQTIGQTIPAWVMPGQPDDVITIHFGYGRKTSERMWEHITDPDSPLPKGGFNAYDVRFSDQPWAATGASVTKTGDRYLLATTQAHFLMTDPIGQHRDVLRVSPIDEFEREKEQLAEEKKKQEQENKDLSLYQDYDYKGQGMAYAWGMSIDLNSCVGCNACMIACQSENNIPIVGKEQVARSREMHWIRVDAYFKGEETNPEGPYFQPVPCMHCENAPCEPVCPVHATVHSAEGLNDMVYNRCVGTKYCSNNCPYKVRRFNFFLYQDWDTPTYQLMRNPDVSVRSRGVMEKCTYCVQRIQAAKIQSEIEGRPVRDGEIVTACQSVCPTEAIVFGNVNDPNSKVSKLKALERDYSLLGELNTRPRTTYLSAVRNPNPEIKS